MPAYCGQVGYAKETILFVTDVISKKSTSLLRHQKTWRGSKRQESNVKQEKEKKKIRAGMRSMRNGSCIVEEGLGLAVGSVIVAFGSSTGGSEQKAH